MSSQMDDPNADDRLSEDQRFQQSEHSTIKPLHALVRCLAQTGDAPMDKTQILRTFFEAGSARVWEEGQLDVTLDEGMRKGLIAEVTGLGWVSTEAGRSEIGPMLEMDLKYV